MKAPLALVAGLALFPVSSTPAWAKTGVVESRSADLDLPTMISLAKEGEVALIEPTPDGRCKQVVIFGLLSAPPEKVWDALMDVASYPKFIRTVVGIQVTKREGNLLTFDWELDVPFFNLKGSRAQRGTRPNLIEVRGLRGHLRGTRERWELYPVDGGKRTLAALYRALDVDTGGVLMETMVKLEPSMEQGAALATGFVHLSGLRRYVEGLPPETTIPGRTGPVPPFKTLHFGEGGLSLPKLEPLLRHGQLALIESYEDGSLRQIAIFANVDAPKEKIAQVVQDPARYPDFMPNFAAQKATPAGPGKLKMEWELEVPLTNLSGQSLMTIEDSGAVDVIAETGDITRGRWRWEFFDRGPGASIPVHYAYSDVRESSWVTKKLVEREPLFEHGIVIASGTIAMTAMKARAEGRR